MRVKILIMNYKVVLTSLILVTLLFSFTAVSASDFNESQGLGEVNEINLDAAQNLNSNDSSAQDGSNITSGEKGSYLVLDNDADIENIYLGEFVTWIVTVQNFGHDKAKNVQVFDHLPDGLEYVSHISTVGSFNPNTGIWNIGDLGVENGEVALYITCKAISAGEQINKALLTTDTLNLNNETLEEEEIDVFDIDDDHDNNHDNVIRKGGSVLKNAGNPILLILMSLIIAFSGFVVKREF